MQKTSDSAAAVHAVHSTLNAYAYAIDTRDWDGLSRLFGDDSMAIYHGLGEFRGAEAIVGLVRSVITQCGATQHLTGTVDIDVTDDTATARSYLQAIHVGMGDNEGQRYTVWGEYHDALEKRGDGWIFTRRELRTQHSEGDIGIVLDA